MNKYYSFEAHMLHSGLQMVWKRLNVTDQMDGWHILVNNREVFVKVASGLRTRFGIVCREDHMKEAAEMLHYAFQLNIPKSFYVIVRSTSHGNQYNVTMNEAGEIVPADSEREQTQEQAYQELMMIKDRHPKEAVWLEWRYPRYVRRTLYGDF